MHWFFKGLVLKFEKSFDIIVVEESMLMEI